MPSTRAARIFGLALGLACLMALYVFQRTNFLGSFLNVFSVDESNIHPYYYFIVNKTFRLIGNDLACMLIIYCFFQQPRYRKVAWYFFLVELLVILPIYFLLKLSLEGDSEISSPLLSQIHRIVVNPMLMLLLMVAFFYQKIRERH